MLLLYLFLPMLGKASEISVGVIFDTRMPGARKVAEIALDDLKSKPVPTLDYNLEFDNEGTCEVSRNWLKSPYLITEFRKKNVTALFGPTCFRDIQAAGRWSSRCDMVMFNLYVEHPKNSEGRNIIQMSTSSTSNIAGNILAFLQGADWKTISVLFCLDCYPDEEAVVVKHKVEAINQILTQNEITIAFTRQVSQKYSVEEYVNALNGVQEVARVIFPFLGNKLENYINLQLAMKNSNFSTADYSTVIPLLQIQPSGITFPWEKDETLADIFNNTIILYNGLGLTSNSVALQMLNDVVKRMPIPDGLEQSYMDLYIHLYESIYVYDALVTQSPPPPNTKVVGMEMIKRLPNSLIGPFGVPITFRKNATRISPFTVYQLKKGSLVELGPIRLETDGQSLIFEVPMFTLNTDRPTCGFQGEYCDQTGTVLIILVVMTAIVAFGIAAIVLKILSRKPKVEPSVPWIVPFNDIRLLDVGEPLSPEDKSNLSLQGPELADQQSLPQNRRRLAIVGQQMSMVDQYLRKERISFKKETAKLLFNIRQLQHDNLNTFGGVTFDKAGSILFLWGSCTRGNLAGFIFENKDIWTKNEKTFTKCFVRDILRGIEYIHSSNIGFHGGLTMSQLFVDRHWILKISGFGIPRLLQQWKISNTITTVDGSPLVPNQELYYLSPEMRKKLKILMYTNRTEVLQYKDIEGQQADMFSFGVILYEILHRKKLMEIDEWVRIDPEEEESLLCEQADALIPFFDPQETQMGKELHNDLKSLIGNCWNLNPVMRPDCNMARKIIDATLKMHGSLVDQMVRNMEGYTKGLESLVNERTAQLEEAQRKADGLLAELLPSSVTNDLKQGKEIQTRTYKSVTIMYSDIVGFTALCSESRPMEVIVFLSHLFSNFDSIIVSNNCYKLETIGDAYCIVSGMPEENRDHVANIAHTSLKMRRFMTDFEVPHRPGMYLHCRWGFNTGTAFSGVVGRRAPKYVVFGQTVTIAAKMEAMGIPDKIQLTHESAKILRSRHPEFILSQRKGDAIKLAGIGYFLTYWLEGVENLLSANDAVFERALSDHEIKDATPSTSAATPPQSSASSARSVITVIHRSKAESFL